jgi:hypothetical protein
VATTGGCPVIGFVAGGIFWMPFAMTASLLVYRLARHYSERDQRRAIHRIQLVNVIKDRQREIWDSNLPAEQKKYLSDKLNQLLEEGNKAAPLQLSSTAGDAQDLLLPPGKPPVTQRNPEDEK